MPDEPELSIKSLSDAALMLEDARKATIKAYGNYRTAKELEDTLRFQLQADLARYGRDNKELTQVEEKDNADA